MDNSTQYNLLTKGWKYYDIMHFNRKVARIYEDGHCTIYFKSYMPYNLYLESGKDLDARINNLNNFYYWCSSRVLMLDRKYAKEIFSVIGAIQAVTDKDRASIALSYHCLSLLDVYWVKNKNENRTFEQMSLFRHSLSNAFVDVCLRGKAITVQNEELFQSRNQAPDLGTPGVAPKAWIRKGDSFYLLKDGDIRDVDAEILASKIAQCFKFESVIYDEDVFDKSPVSKCKIITSEKRGIVSREYIEVYCVNHDKDAYKYILKKDKYNYYMMNIIDYLVGNIDRHWGNWGFYVDNKNNQLLGLYPLMDFNKSFLAYDTLEGTFCQTEKERMTQKDAAINAVKSIGLNLIKEIDEKIFVDEKRKKMFFKRLNILKEAEKGV